MTKFAADAAVLDVKRTDWIVQKLLIKVAARADGLAFFWQQWLQATQLLVQHPSKLHAQPCQGERHAAHTGDCFEAHIIICCAHLGELSGCNIPEEVGIMIGVCCSWCEEI
eukprot:scaffold275392_cov47-Prasinocladus_malaysianus.AAC.2